MRILVDTNIFLDVLLERTEWVDDSLEVLNWCGGHPRDAWIAWHTLSNLWYVGTKVTGKAKARAQLDAILEVFQVATVGTEDARRAGQIPMRDFEDALQASAALACGAERIVTRNTADFKRSPVKAVRPSVFLS